MAKLFVTGALGLLGRSLVPFMQSKEYDVVSQSRAKDGDVNVDLTDYSQCEIVFDQVNPDLIINLAALTNVDICENNPNLAYLSNVHIVENIVRWMKSRSKGFLIHMSTDQVYDGVGPHKEENVVLTNYYAFSKYAGELVASQVPSTILRTNFFGLSECSGRVSFSDWLVGALKKKDNITVFEDVFFSPLSMNKLIELISIVSSKRTTGVFNLGSREGLSKADFAAILAQELGLSSENMRRGVIGDSDLRAYRPKDMRMDSTGFERVFGVELPTLKEEIQSMKGVYTNEAR